MSFLTPAFFWLALLAVPIVLLYMLRLRRREQAVSSTLLWQKLLRDREANSFWQRLRHNWLLIMQLLLLALLVLALARPFLPTSTVVTGNLVVLLDGSASMAAHDESPDRFTVARQEVGRLIDELGGGDQMTLILVANRPIVLAAATSERAALQEALRQTTVTTGSADWPAAFALAAGAAQGYRDARIVIVSDGGLPEALPPLPGEVLYLPVGSRSENVALLALETRRTPDGPELFARLVNHAPEAQRVVLALTVDGALFDSRWIELPGGAETGATWRLPDGAEQIEARVSGQSADFLALDDVAWAVHDGGAGRQVLLVGPGNLFLEQLFAVLPGFGVVKGEFSADTPYDLYIFDRTPLPDPIPPAPLLLIAPPIGDNALVSVTGVISDTRAVRLADSPLLQYVEWGGVNIREAQQLVAPWAQPLISATDGPLLLAGEQNGRRVAIFAFDLLQSDLPLQVAFPVLLANLTTWLAPGQVVEPGTRRVGEPVPLSPGLGTTRLSVTNPAGEVWSAQPGRDTLIYPDTTQPGLYRVTLLTADGEREAGAFAVNLFDEREARIAPAQEVQIGFETVGSAESGAIGQRDLWPWLLALAFAVLLLEWWLYHR